MLPKLTTFLGVGKRNVAICGNFVLPLPMTKLSRALQMIRDERGMTDVALADHIGVHKTVLSRILSGSREAGRETVARLVVSLTGGDVHRLLQAHFEDEMEKIGTMREKKANELGAKLAEPTWAYSVKVSLLSSTRMRK